MKEIFLTRKYKSDQTLGALIVMDDGIQIYSCKTLELPWFQNKRRMSCIPVGMYEVIKRVSPNHGDHFHIQNVPERDMILMHSANFTRQLLGCIAPGKSHTDIDRDGLEDVTNSKLAMNELNEILPDKFKITIR